MEPGCDHQVLPRPCRPGPRVLNCMPRPGHSGWPSSPSWWRTWVVSSSALASWQLRLSVGASSTSLAWSISDDLFHLNLKLETKSELESEVGKNWIMPVMVIICLPSLRSWGLAKYATEFRSGSPSSIKFSSCLPFRLSSSQISCKMTWSRFAQVCHSLQKQVAPRFKNGPSLLLKRQKFKFNFFVQCQLLAG